MVTENNKQKNRDSDNNNLSTADSQKTDLDTDKKTQTPSSHDNKPKVKLGFLKVSGAIITGIFVGGVIVVASTSLTIPNNTSFNDAVSSLFTSLILGLVALITVIVFIIRTLKGKNTFLLNLVVICIFFIIFASVAARTLVVHSNNRIHARQAADNPLIVQNTYAQTANKDARVILSNVSGADIYKQERVANNNKADEFNEVSSLYCFTVPNSSSPNIVTDLNSGLNEVPIMVKGNGFSYNGNIASPNQGQYAGSVSLSSQDVSMLQSDFNQNNQIDMPFSITNQGSNSANIIALKTSNSNYYPQATIDIKVNTPGQVGQCMTLDTGTNTTNKLIVTVGMDLSDDPNQALNF